MTITQILQSANSRPASIVDDDTLATHTNDGLRLTPTERKNAEAALAGRGTDALTKREARALAKTWHLHMRTVGVMA